MNCPHCRRPLIKIDYYGELLVGCIECNRWGRPGEKTLVMELLEADLEALRETHAGGLRHATVRELAKWSGLGSVNWEGPCDWPSYEPSYSDLKRNCFAR